MKYALMPCLVMAMFFISVGPISSQTVTGSGKIVTSEREVDAFTRIEVSHGWDLILHQGRGHRMVIEADDNILEMLRTEVNNGILRIYFENGVRIRRSGRKLINLTFEQLEGIQASGGSDVESVDPLRTDYLKLGLSGGSDMKLHELSTGDLSMQLSGGSDASVDFRDCKRLELQASGGSDVHFSHLHAEVCDLQLSGGSDARLDGKVDEAFINASGGSDISARNLEIQNCVLSLGGGSDAELHCEHEINVTLGGSSDLSYSGQPKVISKSVCKSCSIRAKG